jgi:hypothetical protein
MTLGSRGLPISPAEMIGATTDPRVSTWQGRKMGGRRQHELINMSNDTDADAHSQNCSAFLALLIKFLAFWRRPRK